MNDDLEATLDELGPAYRAVVKRLRAKPRPNLLPYLLAASVLLVFCLPLFVPTSSQPARVPHDYAMSVDEMIASQNADGSWANDFLTRHNAEALRQSADPAAQIAYKKAMRNLRLK